MCIRDRSELKEKKSRIEDALQATRAAVEEGIVAGGGVALVDAIGALDAVKADDKDEDCLLYTSVPVAGVAKAADEKKEA